MTVETRPAVHAIDTGSLEGPLPKDSASEIIKKFKDTMGLSDATGFSITTNVGTVTYSETTGKDNTEARKGLHVTIDNKDASANVYSVKGQTTRETIGWAIRDGKSISGGSTHTENSVEAQVKMENMLSRFINKGQSAPINHSL